MQGNDPPSTFQVHGGEELNKSWVAADKMEPLNDFYEENDWMDKYPEELIDLVSDDGNIYSVPVNVHRGNPVFITWKYLRNTTLTYRQHLMSFLKRLISWKKIGRGWWRE